MNIKNKIDVSLKPKEKFEQEKILVEFLDTYSVIESFFIPEEEFLSNRSKLSSCSGRTIDDYKNANYIKSRNNLFTLNLLMEDKALTIKPKPIIQKISISIPNEETPLTFKAHQSVLEVLLSSMDLEDREKIYSTFHPSNKKGKDKFSELTKQETIKKEFIKEYHEQLINPYSQLKIYEQNLDMVIGNEWKKKAPLQYYQVLSLLLDIKYRFGINIKTLFKRLEDDPSFDFIPEIYIEPHKVNSTIDEVHNFLLSQKVQVSETPDKNVNFYPAVLKEIITYLLDACEDCRVKALIKTIPELFERLIFLQKLPISLEKERNQLQSIKKIVSFLNQEQNLFVYLAYKIQLKLITNKHRSLSKMWGLIKAHPFNSDSKEQRNSFSKLASKIQPKLQEPEYSISLVGKDVYEPCSKFIFQFYGLLAIIKNHRNDYIFKNITGKQGEPNLTDDMKLILELIAHEKLIYKKKINIFKQFNPAVSSGKKTIPANKLGALERAYKIASSRNEPLSYHLYRTHYHYWVLLYEYYCTINNPDMTIKEREAVYNKYIINAWNTLTDDIGNSAQHLLFN